jgi:heme oxygenase
MGTLPAMTAERYPSLVPDEPILIEALRSATRTLHVELERGPLVRELLRGELPRPAYGAMLRNLLAIYQALERGLSQHAQRPTLAWLPLRALRRVEALEVDLGVWHGPRWAEELPVHPLTLDYQKRLDRLSQHDPDLLLAHAYVRYLGDLSGGQSLQRLVARQMGTTTAEGTRFYQFGTGDEVRSLAGELRAGLGRDHWPRAQVEALAEEASWSFRQHALIFGALAKEHGLSSPTSAL